MEPRYPRVCCPLGACPQFSSSRRKLCMPPSVPKSDDTTPATAAQGKFMFFPAQTAKRKLLLFAGRPGKVGGEVVPGIFGLVGSKLFMSLQFLESSVTASAITAAEACGSPKPASFAL